MAVSLIIATYNWEAALELVLKSVFRQTVLPVEIIIADDGSSDGTDKLVTNLAKQSPVAIIHSWQKDKGFRAAKSRNRAIAKARGDYLILIDGDMVLSPCFVEDHQAAAAKGYFIQAGRVLISKDRTSEMLRDKIIDVNFWDKGIENKKNCLRSTLMAKLFSSVSTSLSGIRTCNFSFWKEDAVSVNGFNEDFTGWGREDSEFAARLLYKGIKRKNIKFMAAGYHLYHPLQNRAALLRNDHLLNRTITEKLTWCPNGLNNHL